MTNNKWHRKRVTIKDIARRAGVDPSTVTRALQGSDRVKQTTRDVIQQLARDLGYVPSALARSLVTRRSKLIGVVLPDMTNPFFSALVRGIEAEAAKHQLRVLIRSTDGIEDAERDAIGLFIEFGVDGLIVPMARGSKAFYAGLGEDTPLIHVNRDDASEHVSCDAVSGSQELIAHLIGLGHRRIAFINGPASPARDPKHRGYKNALEQASIDYDASLVYEFDGTPESLVAIADTLLRTSPRPTALFAWNDVCAIRLIHIMHERGIRVPQDLSIAGHDDIDMASLIQPTLTTVHWPMYELGVESVRCLLRLRDEKVEDSPPIPSPELILRASTGAPDQ